MTSTVALRAGGVLVLIGLFVGALGFGPQWAGAMILPGVAAALLASMGGTAALRHALVPVRVRRRPGGR